MAIKVEAYGTRQKKTCFGCGSMISFENDDIKVTNGNPDDNSYIECPVCGKKIKAYKIDRTKPVQKNISELGKLAKKALDDKENWDAEE